MISFFLSVFSSFFPFFRSPAVVLIYFLFNLFLNLTTLIFMVIFSLTSSLIAPSLFFAVISKSLTWCSWILGLLECSMTHGNMECLWPWLGRVTVVWKDMVSLSDQCTLQQAKTKNPLGRNFWELLPAELPDWDWLKLAQKPGESGVRKGNPG